MFLKQEKPEMDDFGRKQNFCTKDKMLKKNIYIYLLNLTDTLAKMSQNIFAYSSVSEHSKHFFLYFEKKLPFLSAGRGGRVKNAFLLLFYLLPKFLVIK